jgi:hypothetical protein
MDFPHKILAHVAKKITHREADAANADQALSGRCHRRHSRAETPQAVSPRLLMRVPGEGHSIEEEGRSSGRPFFDRAVMLQKQRYVCQQNTRSI